MSDTIRENASATPAQAAPELLLETRSLGVTYGKMAALREASIRVPVGSIVSVIGPNGAGKSSLLNAIMGLLPAYGAATGQVYFQGNEIDDLPVEQRLQAGMALVPETRELFGSMSVEDNLALGAYRRHQAGVRPRDAREAVYDIFPRLRERSAQMAGTLSGGERQMLAIGRALMSAPRLLLLDEPSLGLAPRIMDEVFAIIERLRDSGVATLLVEQNSRAALQVADYGYVLEVGDVVLEGLASELAEHPKVVEAYLGAAPEAASA